MMNFIYIVYMDEDNEIIECEIIYKTKMKTMECDKCKTDEYIYDDEINGIIVCKNCGNIIDTGKIVNDGDYKLIDEKTGKMSLPLNIFLQQSSTGITIHASYYNKYRRLSSWYAIPYKERSLNNVFKEIQLYCEKGNISKCIEQDAKILFHMIITGNYKFGKNKGKNVITRGDHRKSLIASCVFMACKRCGMPRSSNEISTLFDIKPNVLNRGRKTFVKLMKNNINTDIGVSSIEHFIKRYGKQLKLNKKTTDDAINIGNIIKQLNIATEHTTIAIAIACILLSCNINEITDIDINFLSIKFNVSNVTISKIYKKIIPIKSMLNQLIPINGITNNIPIEIFNKQKEIEIKKLLNYIKNASIVDLSLCSKMKSFINLSFA